MVNDNELDSESLSVSCSNQKKITNQNSSVGSFTKSSEPEFLNKNSLSDSAKRKVISEATKALNNSFVGTSYSTLLNKPVNYGILPTEPLSSTTAANNRSKNETEGL